MIGSTPSLSTWMAALNTEQPATAPSADAPSSAPADTATVTTPSAQPPLQSTPAPQEGAMKRMWDGAKAGSTNGWRCGIEQGRKKGMSAMALAGGLAGAGVCLYYAASLWSESPLITLIFGIPITGLTFTAGATVGRLLGAVLGPVVGAPVGAALGAMKGAYAGLKGDPPPEPCPPPDDANQQP